MRSRERAGANAAAERVFNTLRRDSLEKGSTGSMLNDFAVPPTRGVQRESTAIYLWNGEAEG